MKKTILVFSIFVLVLFTTFTKNSTKKIDKENIIYVDLNEDNILIKNDKKQ